MNKEVTKTSEMGKLVAVQVDLESIVWLWVWKDNPYEGLMQEAQRSFKEATRRYTPSCGDPIEYIERKVEHDLEVYSNSRG